ncbi:MAG: replication initiation protein [Thiofilum sp.]|uniref:replication initiation protein RepM n=1 Tax=Thiofilum sp. TaxID=2212733 RepID=UPI0025DFC37F|nr:replication initiation protein RepM [Thiofilum sp.]MBK8455337.1 replication initiation protein [Thiofilum sp.]
MKDLIVKDNALINAGYSLTIVEQRIILLAIVEARRTNTGITANDPLTIHADSYITHFDAHKNTAYSALQEACKNLFERRFTYQEINKKGNLEKVYSRWVSEVRYIDNEASVKLIFSPAVVPLITQLEKQFTSYEIEQVSNLSSTYAIRLYELLIQWRSAGKTPIFEMREFKSRLGVEEKEYIRMSDFKKRVLDLAIEQINENTDITASYEQHKAGRVITGFSFTFKFKKSAKTTKKTTLEPTPTPAPDPDAEKREAYAQFLNYQRQAKLLKETIEQLATKKELKQFKTFGFMK